MAHIEELMEYGIKFYLHKGFLHSKTIVADEIVTSVGTCNFDIRSFLLNYEVNAFIYDKEFSRKYTETFFNDIKSCILLDYREFSKRSILKKLSEKILKLFSPLA